MARGFVIAGAVVLAPVALAGLVVGVVAVAAFATVHGLITGGGR